MRDTRRVAILIVTNVLCVILQRISTLAKKSIALEFCARRNTSARRRSSTLQRPLYSGCTTSIFLRFRENFHLETRGA